MQEHDSGAMIVASDLATIRGAQGYEELTSFTQLKDAVRVERDSREWLERFLVPEASPYRKFLRVKRYVHRASRQDEDADILKHVYRAGQLDLVVSETDRFVHVAVSGGTEEILSVPPSDRAQRIMAIARSVLNMEGTYHDGRGNRKPYAWRFAFPEEIGEGTSFRTSGENPMHMETWASRLDGGIKAGRLWFLIHKRRVVTSGREIWLDESQWFSGKALDGYNRPRR